MRGTCGRLGISRTSVVRWLHADPEFALRYKQAELDGMDVLRAEAFRRAVQGVEKPLTSMGKLVYEEIPDIDPTTGQQRLDRYGRPQYTRGKLVTIREYSDSTSSS
jgi:hypothetical protein